MRSLLIALLLAIAFRPSLLGAAQTAKTPARKPASARSTATAGTQAPSTVPCNCASATPPPAQHVQPYTIKRQTTHVQTLADGTIITTVQASINARDAEGRIYADDIRTLNGEVTHTYSIFDYPTQTRYTWADGPNYPRIVSVFRPRPVQQQQTAPTPAADRRYYPYRSESLPPQTIDGMYAEGTRYTRTIPAGYQGNDHDLVTTTESWNAPDLGRVMLRQIVDDPRSGKSTTETTDIQQSADPSLFQPPAGYTLKDASP